MSQLSVFKRLVFVVGLTIVAAALLAPHKVAARASSAANTAAASTAFGNLDVTPRATLARPGAGA